VFGDLSLTSQIQNKKGGKVRSGQGGPMFQANLSRRKSEKCINRLMIRKVTIFLPTSSVDVKQTKNIYSVGAFCHFVAQTKDRSLQGMSLCCVPHHNYNYNYYQCVKCGSTVQLGMQKSLCNCGGPLHFHKFPISYRLP
jgi:hypothetical protein